MHGLAFEITLIMTGMKIVNIMRIFMGRKSNFQSVA